MRVFVAVWPPAEVLDALAELPRPENAALRWTTREQWHVTLRFVGSVDEDEQAELRARLASCVLPGSVRASLGPATARFGRQVLHVPVAGLDAHAAAVVEATGSVGQPPSAPFTGHLTLARVRGRARVDLRPYCGVPIAAAWDVGEIALVRSYTDPEGGRYEVIDRRSLQP